MMKHTFSWVGVAITTLALGCAGELDQREEHEAAILGRLGPPLDNDNVNDNDNDNSSPGDPLFSACADAPPAFFTAPVCVSCHGENSVFLGARGESVVDLLSEGVEARLIGVTGQCPEVALADPADPQASSMIRWLVGDVDCDAELMPFSGPPLEQAEIDCATEWIDSLDGVADWEGSGPE